MRARPSEEAPVAPAMAVEAQPHEVASAQRKVTIEGALLRDVADPVGSVPAVGIPPP